MTFLRLILVLLITLAAAPALAVQPDEMLADPALEARARTLSQELRCMVCQNQSIDDSGAPLARDLRLLVRERLKAGDSDCQVLDFMVRRYGDFVLLKPPLKWDTVVLWFIGPLVLLIAALGLWPLIRKARSGGSEPNFPSVPLSPSEESRVKELLGTGDVSSPAGTSSTSH